MSKARKTTKKSRFFSLSMSILLVLGILFVGFSIHIPNASAGSVNHNVGNVDILFLTDYGRLCTPISWSKPQTVSDPLSGLGFIGVVIDQDNYDHPPGTMDIADPYLPPPPYLSQDDFAMSGISMVVDDGITQKSKGYFQNVGLGTGDPNDIFVEQTVWTVLNKDWAILQWKLNNLKATDITGVCIGLEVPISQEGANFGLGGGGSDGGDDIDDFDSINGVYWAQDTLGSGTGTTIGFGSAIASEPITHYFAEDYHAEYQNPSDTPGNYDPDPSYYVNFFANETWLYNRLRAANATATDGVTPGNITATVGWNDITIPVGSSRTFNLVIAVNDSQTNMISALEDARYYYYNVATGFILTEFSDSDSATQQIEIFNFGRGMTNLPGDGYFLSVDGGASALTGTWSNNPLPPYEHAVFTVTGGSIGPEGDTIGLYQDIAGTPVLQDEISYGQEGVAPDPIADESVGRYYGAEYTSEWIRNASTGPTWGAQNDVGSVILTPLIVLNRVMFNPIDAAEGYVELMYTGSSSLDISGYRIVCDAEYIIPSGTILNSNNRFYVLTQSDYSAGFDLDDGTGNGDNVYLYDDSGNLLDMVGWSSPHTQGYFMSRTPDGNGTHQGYDDATSMAAEWVFDQLPILQLTEFYVDGTSAQIEVYNPRGGDKVLDAITPRWILESTVDGGGALQGTWSPTTIPANGGYSTFTLSSGSPGDEGDTISLFFDPGSGSILMDEVSFGTYGTAPDPVNGESTSRYWDNSISEYSDNWTREDTTTFGSQNDVPAIDPMPFIILNEVMFNPSISPDGKYVVIFNRQPGFYVNVSNFYLVCDDVYQLPSYPIVPGGFDGNLYPNWSLIIRYGDDAASDSFFTGMTPSGDNVYLYDSTGQLLDMVGWNTAHTQGMCARRVPDGYGTFQGHDDTTSEAAGWVFSNPLMVLITEISDSGSSPSQIEVYNPWYPIIDFLDAGFTFSGLYGALGGTWTIQTADSGEYAIFDVDSGTPLGTEGDTITLDQNSVFVEDVSYGILGTVPDPLAGESVQRYWYGSAYTDVWERNTPTGPNFGSQNNVPLANFTSVIILNEALFYPNAAGDYFVEVYHRGAAPIDISGYKIVCDTEYVIPPGTVLDFDNKFFYLLNTMDPTFFGPNMDSTGDNIYLYDANGALLDMVGWNTQHTQGGTVCRVPDGNGTRDGYDDTSSIAAGWQFDRTPTVRLIKIDTQDGQQPIKYGHLGGDVIFNLTVTNLQSLGDIINILNSTEEGWTVQIFDETGTIKITDISLGADEMGNITIIVTLPDTVPIPIMDNITILVRSTNSQIIGDTIVLNVKVYPFLNLTKTVNPNEVYINGAGLNETATITLNMTGMGAQVAVRKYLDTVFCIDSSGSMTTTDPTNLRITESQNFVMRNFKVPDRAAVVDFDDDAWLVPKGWPLGDHLSSDYKTIVDNLALIDSNGWTYISYGLNLSNEELKLYGQPNNHTLNIILITDAGSSSQADIDACYVEADIAASRGVIIFTIGLSIAPGGQGEQLLMDIASITGGMYFPAPDASYFGSIYENISQYLADLAVWDDDVSDPNPMVRDVLPPYIEYVPGSFTIPPDNVYTDPATGETIIEWNVKQVKLGQTWSVSFDIKSNIPGFVETNVYDLSRAYYTRWDNSTTTKYFPHCWLNVLPAKPRPPKLFIDTLPNKNDIYLYWNEPTSPGTYHYLIYTAKSPTGFDFSAPWNDTSIDIDPYDPGGPVGDRLSWNHTNAVNLGSAEYSDQWYYCVRAVNSLGEISDTSRTVGAWTKIFPSGNATFSLPLEPFTIENTEFYAQDMNARLIKYMNPVTHDWVQHDQGEVGDITDVVIGKGYEVDFTSSTKYTFLGMPGAMIRYNDGAFIGFDYITEADSLLATVDPLTDDVILTWAQPLGMDGNDNYEVYRSATRDGFDDGTALLLTTLPYGTETYVDFGAASLPGEYYYLIIPVDDTDTDGASTYSIGVWTAGIDAQYDTIGLPLIPRNPRNADYFCENIDNTIGINYFIYSSYPRWGWHSTRMSAGAYDPVLVMGEAYQICTITTTKFSFIGH
ncbi:MAG: lamin tail domain-containing protein [Thermoplasmata archaeon]|nr:MAG: lamin tail domain-containing protein [Thermoplasmata archaeon]